VSVVLTTLCDGPPPAMRGRVGDHAVQQATAWSGSRPTRRRSLAQLVYAVDSWRILLCPHKRL
jgi:hypothetical protein